MPEVVIIVVPFEDKGVAHIVAGTGAGIGVCAILLLQFGIDLLVDDSDYDYDLVIHDFSSTGCLYGSCRICRICRWCCFACQGCPPARKGTAEPKGSCLNDEIPSVHETSP